MSAINNDASRFLTLVARQFDLLHFPKAEPMPVIKEEGTLFTPPSLVDNLSTDVQAMVHDNTVNFAHWVKSTRFLEPPLEDAGKESVRKTAMEKSAKQLLEKLNKPLGYIKPYSEQLLTYVFQDAFNRVKADPRPDERDDIIYLANRLQPALDKLPFTLRRTKYKVEFIVAKILNHTVAKIVLTFAAYKIAEWVQPRIYHLLSQTVIPRGVNYLINHAHLSVIRVVSGGVALVQFAYFYYWRATITFYAAKLVAGTIDTRLNRAVTVVENFAFFPSRVIKWLVMGPFSLLTSSWQMNTSIAESLASSTEKNKAKLLEEGGMKAYRTWMELMQCGIKADLIPKQPVAASVA